MLGGSLQRFAAAAAQHGLGFGGIAPAAVASCGGSSSSSSVVWLRGLADDAGDKPAGETTPAAEAPPAAAATSGEPAAATEAAAAAAGEQPVPEDTPEALIDFHDGSVVPRELFTKRQLAWMGLEDPDKYKHFLPRLSRKELGSFADEYAAEEFDVEQALYPEVPENQPLYNLRDTVPEIYQNKTHLFDRLQRLKQERYPDMPIEEFAKEVLGFDAAEEQPPRPGARRIIRWEVRHVFAAGVNEAHPANKKVKAWVYLRDLQREHGLSDAALQHMARVCGPRYNPNTGELKLTSDRYPHREANRAHIRQIIDALVEEGHRKFPAQQQQQQQQQAQAAS